MMKGLATEEQAAYWKRVYRETPVKALEAIKEGAKQLITITSASQGLYFLAISVSNVRAAVTDWRIVLFALPVVPWLICLGLAVSVFVPESHYIIRKPDRIEGAESPSRTMPPFGRTYLESLSSA